MKILVVGDSFVPVPVFQRGLAALQGNHDIEYLQLDESHELVPATASELSIREYLGTPAQIASRVQDAEILVVHGAPTTDEVLAAASRLQLICCARCGPAPRLHGHAGSRVPQGTTLPDRRGHARRVGVRGRALPWA